MRCAIMELGGEGVGLVPLGNSCSSDRPDLPSRGGSSFQAYKKGASMTMDGRPRHHAAALDIGRPDKDSRASGFRPLAYLEKKEPRNPLPRLPRPSVSCLNRTRPVPRPTGSARVLARRPGYGDLRIMFPMISSSIDELRPNAKQVLREASDLPLDAGGS